MTSIYMAILTVVQDWCLLGFKMQLVLYLHNMKLKRNIQNPTQILISVDEPIFKQIYLLHGLHRECKS